MGDDSDSSSEGSWGERTSDDGSAMMLSRETPSTSTTGSLSMGGTTTATTPLDAGSKSRERNRMHARKSRQRKKEIIDHMRLDATNLQNEQTALRVLYRNVFKKEYQPSTPAVKLNITNVVADVSVDIVEKIEGALASDLIKEAERDEPWDPSERARQRNRIHARKSRLRKKAVVECLKSSVSMLRSAVADLRQLLVDRLGEDSPELARIRRSDLLTTADELQPSSFSPPAIATPPPTRGRPRKSPKSGVYDEAFKAAPEEGAGAVEVEEPAAEESVSLRGRRRKSTANSDFDTKVYGRGSRGGKATRNGTTRGAAEAEEEEEEEERKAEEGLSGRKRKRPARFDNALEVTDDEAGERETTERKEKVAVKAGAKDRKDRDDAANLLVLLSDPGRFQ